MATLKRWVLRKRPVGEIRPGDLELVEEPILHGALRTALDAVRNEVFGSTVG